MHYLSLLITISTCQVYFCIHDAVVFVNINWTKMHMILCSTVCFYIFVIPHLYDLECVRLNGKYSNNLRQFN